LRSLKEFHSRFTVDTFTTVNRLGQGKLQGAAVLVPGLG